MPMVEIRELHIKAVVGTEPPGRQPRGPRGQESEQDMDALVAQCVEQVMEILRKEKER
jgi:hypothetical protein